MKRRPQMLTRFGLTLLAIALPSFSGCGRSGPPAKNDSSIAVVGKAAFGSQCPYGTVTEPAPIGLALWDCPLGLDPVQLIKPPQALVLQADCGKKTLSLRSTDRKVDSAWEVMPDGTFTFTVDGGAAVLATDGAGHSGCTTYMSAEFSGKLTCNDRDRVDINVDVVWRLGKGAVPSALPAGTVPCTLPAGCYLHASALIRQCQ